MGLSDPFFMLKYAASPARVSETLDMFRPVGTSGLEAPVVPLSSRDRKVFLWIQARGSHGATRAEVAAGLGILDQSIGSIFKTLREVGVIQDTGDKRSTPSGRPARIFVAAG